MHCSFGKKYLRFLAGVLPLISCGSSVTNALAGEINLAWNPNTEPTLAGYKLYYGTSSGGYVATINVGKVTSYKVAGLGTGNYYLAVTAYDASGNESRFSNEVSTTVSSAMPGGSGCDVNGDGGSNALDLRAEINAILVGSNSSSFDVNRDGIVNALDLQKLGNVVLGTSSCP